MCTTTIDLQFRPASYWNPADPESAVLGNIKGQFRRQMARDFLRREAPEELGEIEEQYLEDEVSDEFRVALGRIHPQFMGGEYLPGYRRGEVEIARVVLNSATMDVTSLRARRQDGWIYYRMVDEYDGEYFLTNQTSRQPLTLGELIELIRGTEPGNQEMPLEYPLGILEFRASEREQPEDVMGFVRLESTVYPQLAAWWERHVAEWAAARRKAVQG